ncbi:MAG TPA: hypothetical protein PKD18_08130 [Saprospiraceae bacterium]|nr:hypothetical protein [Saprospiraceae bacterium]
MQITAGIITCIFSLVLIALLIVVLTKKEWAISFISAFASTAKAHFIEQSLRLIAGASILIYSENMLFPKIFNLFGWILMMTSAILMLTPWKWHQSFGKVAMPLVIKNLILYAIAAAAMGMIILYCVIAPLDL